MASDQVRYENSDWRQLLPSVDEPVQLVVCDPVYDAADLSWIGPVVEKMAPGAWLFCFSDAGAVAETKVALGARSELVFQNWLIWGPNDWGGRSRRRFGQKHDDILAFTRKGAEHTFNGEAVAVPKKMTMEKFNPSGRQTKIPHSVWSDLGGFSTMSSERVRIDGVAVRWQKPERLIERIVLAASNPGDLVLDPFSGVATVPAVCARLGRRCAASEIDRSVWRAGRRRLDLVLDQIAADRA